MPADQQLMERCIAECLDVVRAANRCANACLTGGQADDRVECIRLCLDAATITGDCAALMARDSRFASQVCGVCATICDACAAECERYQGEPMRLCVEVCRRCAATCRQAAA